jgi:hypothetical protein
MGSMPYLCNDLHLSLADLGSFVSAKSTLTEGVLHCDYQSHFEILVYVNTTYYHNLKSENAINIINTDIAWEIIDLLGKGVKLRQDEIDMKKKYLKLSRK